MNITTLTSTTCKFLPEIPLTSTEKDIWEVVKLTFDNLPIAMQRNFLDSMGIFFVEKQDPKNENAAAIKTLFDFAVKGKLQALKSAMASTHHENILEVDTFLKTHRNARLVDLMHACEIGDVNKMDGIFDCPLYLTNDEIYQVFNVAEENDQLESAVLLYDSISCDKEWTLIERLIDEGKTEFLKKLLYSGELDPNHHEGFLLRTAVEEENVFLVNLLLSLHAFSKDIVDPTVKNNEPIRLAALSGNEEIVDLLMKDNRVNSMDRRGGIILDIIGTIVSENIILKLVKGADYTHVPFSVVIDIERKALDHKLDDVASFMNSKRSLYS